jgi:transcriptional regulator with GAF, ATPase, and Fis domain
MIGQASDGTIFLDEIGELSDASQVKLLRLLQEHEFFPLGADRPSRTNARVLAATNRDLEKMVRERRFREDLYYRLATHHVHLPPLSQRLGDIPLLLDIFIAEAAKATGKNPPRFHPSLCDYLATYHFPGNIRELKAMVFDAVARANSPMLQNELFLDGLGARQISSSPDPGSDAVLAAATVIPGRLPTLREAQEVLVAKALELAGGNQGVAARHLGITRQGLNKMLNRNKT